MWVWATPDAQALLGSPNGNSNSHGARPVHLIITMIKWIQSSRLPIKNARSLAARSTPARLDDKSPRHHWLGTTAETNRLWGITTRLGQATQGQVARIGPEAGPAVPRRWPTSASGVTPSSRPSTGGCAPASPPGFPRWWPGGGSSSPEAGPGVPRSGPPQDRCGVRRRLGARPRTRNWRSRQLHSRRPLWRRGHTDMW